MFIEGVMRKPRLWSNKELKKIAHLFTGMIINVSGAQDSDKEVKSYFKYLLTKDVDCGNKYQQYFVNATKYYISNYYEDNRRGHLQNDAEDTKKIYINLDEPIRDELKGKFDVVFNHTVLEHVFDIFTAFKNLCMMSKDIVIIIIPSVQMVHDYNGAYKDYWRFTPFAIDELFKKNGMKVLYRSSNKPISGSVYYFYVASKSPEKWIGTSIFSEKKANTPMNLGNSIYSFAQLHLRAEILLRTIASKVISIVRK